MSNSITFGKYIKTDLELYKLNSIYKIISFIIMIFICFFINSYIDIIMLFSYLLLGLVYSGISIKIYLKELLIIKVILFSILIVDMITLTPIVIILSDLFRIIFIFLYFSLLMKSTTLNEIIYAVREILRPFDKITNNIILNISLIFKFPYTFLKIREKYYYIETEKKVKKSKELKSRIIKYKNDLINIFNLSLKELNNEIEYLKVKLYGYGKSRTNYHLNEFDKKEIIFIILNILIVLIIMFH